MSFILKYEKPIQIAFVILSLLTIWLALNTSFVYLTILIPLFLFLILFTLSSSRHRRQLELQQILNQWPIQSTTPKDYSCYTQLFKQLPDDLASLITPQTSLDLNLDDIFERIDYTVTVPGQQFLYRLLHTPSLTQKEVDTRKKVVANLDADTTLRTEIYKAFFTC